MSIMPPKPTSYIGQVAIPYINKTFPPTTDFNKFPVPTIWIDTSSEVAYILVSVSEGIAAWVPIGGVPGEVESLTVDTFTAPGTNPVFPNGSQTIAITGGQVAAGTVGTDVIQTNSLAASKYTVQIQRSTATASSTVADNGVSHFNSSNFTVDSNAFVSLIGLISSNPGATNVLTIENSSNT